LVNQHLETLWIPEVIKQALRFLNSYDSLQEQGIYRIPGDTQKIRQYRDVFNRGESIDFLQENEDIDSRRREARENGTDEHTDITHHGVCIIDSLIINNDIRLNTMHTMWQV